MTNFNKLTSNFSVDYRSPFMRATIVRPDGNRFPLWTNLGLTEAQKESVRLTTNTLPYLQELTIELQPAYVPIMKAKLVFPYREGLAFLNSKLIEWGYSTLEVVIGYTGGSPSGPYIIGNSSGKVLSPTFQGILLQPDVQIGNEISITLNAQGIGAFAAANTTRTGGPYVGSRRDLIEKIFAPGPDPKTKRNLKVDFSRVTDYPVKDIAAYDGIYEEVEVAPSGKSDWAIIFELLQEANCWMFSIGNTIHAIPKASLADSVTRVFRHYDYQAGNMSSSSGVYPVLGFSTDAPAIYLPSETIGYWSADIQNGDPKKLIEHVVNQDNIKPETTGKGNVSPAKTKNNAVANEETKDGLGFFAGRPEVPKWVSQMKQDLRASAQYIGMKINLDTLGIPDLMPLEIIAVRGFGERIDGGNFGIFKIIHTLGTGGFRTSLECYKNVQGQVASELNPPQQQGISSPHTLPSVAIEGKIPAQETKKTRNKKDIVQKADVDKKIKLLKQNAEKAKKESTENLLKAIK